MGIQKNWKYKNVCAYIKISTFYCVTYLNTIFMKCATGLTGCEIFMYCFCGGTGQQNSKSGKSV